MKKFKLYGSAVLIALIAIVLVYVIQLQQYINIDNIQVFVESFGLLGGIIFLILATLRPLLLMPSPVFFLLGGVLFGVVKGTLLNIGGLVMGAVISYYLANRFSRLIIRLFGDKYINKLHRINEKDIIKTLFSMRVTPGFPFDPVSYAAGVTGININYFIIGTLLGSTPKIFVYTLLGDGLENVYSLQTIIAFGFLIILALLPVVYKKLHNHS